jgi:hypothetical protein
MRITRVRSKSCCQREGNCVPSLRPSHKGLGWPRSLAVAPIYMAARPISLCAAPGHICSRGCQHIRLTAVRPSPSHMWLCTAHLFACGCTPSPPSHTCAAHLSSVAVCPRCRCTHARLISRVWLCALAAIAHTCSAHLFVCGCGPRRRRTHVRGSSLCVWLCALAAVAHTCSAHLFT